MKKTISINTILGGHSSSEYFSREGEIQSSISIDPDFPKDDTSKKTSGLLRPVAMADFSGANVDNIPLWIETNPKDTKVYVYLANGKLVSYTNALGGEALPATATSSAGNGMAYYDNYLYLSKNTDIARYGLLDGTPSITQSYWVGTLSKSALIDTTYPTIRGVEIPNHHLHRHTDDKLYICDVVGNKGSLHYIKTKKTTNEGDTDDGSTASALDFDYGYYPVATETYGTDLAVALIEGVDTTVAQKPAVISFWDTSASSFTKIIQKEFPDPLITAIKNINGVLYVWSGESTKNVRLSRFIGGYSFEEVAYDENGILPLQGAVDGIMNRIVWGNKTNVYAHGSKRKDLPMGLHSILKSKSAGANGVVTAVKYALQDKKAPIVGWHDDDDNGIDKVSTTYGAATFNSEIYKIGQKFEITKITIPLVQAVASNMTITPTIHYDDGSSYVLDAINTTNFNGKRKAVYDLQEKSADNNFYLSLVWSGTALLTVGLPIVIEINILEDNAG